MSVSQPLRAKERNIPFICAILMCFILLHPMVVYSQSLATVSAKSLATVSASIALPLGPTVFTVLPLLDSAIPVDGKIQFVFWKSLDEAIAMVARRQVDFIFLPVSYAATLYEKGLPLRLVAVTLWKSFYAIAKSPFVYKNLESLRGRTIFLAQGKGQTADIVIRALLLNQGMVADRDVAIRYLSPPEIVAIMETGIAQFTVLPEPYISLILNKNPDTRLAFDLQQLWGDTFGVPPRLPITGVFYVPAQGESSSFSQKSAQQTIQLLSDSVNTLVSNPEKFLESSQKYFSGFGKEVIRSSFFRSDFGFSDSATVKEEVFAFLKTVQHFTPKGVVTLPDENFFLF